MNPHELAETLNNEFDTSEQIDVSFIGDDDDLYIIHHFKTANKDECSINYLNENPELFERIIIRSKVVHDYYTGVFDTIEDHQNKHSGD